MDNTINWEQVRILASILILSGICANHHHPYPSSFLCDEAIEAADSLIDILKKQDRP